MTAGKKVLMMNLKLENANDWIYLDGFTFSSCELTKEKWHVSKCVDDGNGVCTDER